MSDKRRLKVYKITVYVIDHDGVGRNRLANTLENENRYISPIVDAGTIAERTVDYHDQHPINITSGRIVALRELFDPRLATTRTEP